MTRVKFLQACGAAAEAVKGANLLEYDRLYDLMMAKNLPKSQIATVDIACWDLHARMVKKTPHAGRTLPEVPYFGKLRVGSFRPLETCGAMTSNDWS